MIPGEADGVPMVPIGSDGKEQTSEEFSTIDVKEENVDDENDSKGQIPNGREDDDEEEENDDDDLDTDDDDDGSLLNGECSFSRRPFLWQLSAMTCDSCIKIVNITLAKEKGDCPFVICQNLSISKDFQKYIH